MARTTTAPAEPAAAEPLLPAADAPAPDPTEPRVDPPAPLDDAPVPVGLGTEPEETPPAERPLSRHDAQMAAIVEHRRQRLDAERAEGRAQGMADQEPVGAAGAPVDAQIVPAAPEAPDPASPAPAPSNEPAAPVRTHKILVRGNEIMMSDDDMRRAAELGVESEARIRHADQVLQEARRLAAASGQPIPSAGPSPPAAPPQAQPQAPSDSDRDAMRELARELLYGDEEKVVDALHRVVTRQPAQPVDPEAVARDVYARVNSSLGVRSDLQTFGSEYPEIVNDPRLATLTADHVQQLRKHYETTGSPRAELALFREAGDATRQFVAEMRAGDRLAPPTPDPNPAPAPQPGPSRITVKRNTPQAPAAAAAPQTPTAPREKTAHELVNDMRRQRGQPLNSLAGFS